jgi:transcriptional regulator of acetoin/glycerol metabolism
VRKASLVEHIERLHSVLDQGQLSRARMPEAPVLRSWKRSLAEFGVEPSGARELRVLDSAAVRERQDAFGDRLDLARAEMENLYQQIAGSGYAILLTDSEGTVISHVLDPALRSEFQRAGLWLGADWSEEHEGTNGIGTALKERRSITIHGDDHFRSQHIALSCSGAPILDPYGRLLAVLDASSARTRDTRESQRHTLALVSMSARLLENCNFLREFRNDWVLRFHSRPEYVGLLNEAILAIGDDGRILAANPSALAQLEFDEGSQLVGRMIQEVLFLDMETLGRRARTQSATVSPIRELGKGMRFFAMIRAPATSVGTQTCRSRDELPKPAENAVAEVLTLEDLAGRDKRMSHNVRCAAKVVDKRVPILLCGETGTGKEVMARAIHLASDRAEKPFVPVNCAAIPETLIESELFGYKHGAFTGARREGMRGRIVQADGGTLFLDEIGDMPPQLQTRLLRVLELREVLPLGDDSPTLVDINLISATHQNLSRLIAEGRFREDLYYRLNGITLTLPPLRERSDLYAIIRSALATENDTCTRADLDEDAFRALASYFWPGNIRQLRNVLRTALALSDDGLVGLAELPPEITGIALPSEQDAADSDAVAAASSRATASNALENAERLALLRELERHCWNITSTSAALTMSRNTLYRKMHKYGIHCSRPR